MSLHLTSQQTTPSEVHARIEFPIVRKYLNLHTYEGAIKPSSEADNTSAEFKNPLLRGRINNFFTRCQFNYINIKFQCGELDLRSVVFVYISSVAHKQPRRPVKKTFSFDKIAAFNSTRQWKGKCSKIIYFPVRFTIKTLPKYTF